MGRTVHRVRGGGGTLLHVEEAGQREGRPVLFIHGFSSCGQVWWRQMGSDLGEEFRLVTMDLRGHGRSEKPRDGYADPALWAEDVNAVITALRLERPVLVGWSYGGLVIGDYLAAHGGEAISGINLVAAITRIGTRDMNALLGREFKSLIPGLYAQDIDENMAALLAYVPLCSHGDPDPADFYATVGYNALVPPHVRRSMFNRALDRTVVLETLPIPVLVTHGEQDEIVLLGAGRDHAHRLPTATASFWAATGHTPFAEDPARFNRELRAFVATLS